MPIELKGEQPVAEEELIEDLNQDLSPQEEHKEEPKQEEEKVPFHQDPTIQAYIERQVQKRIGEGNRAWEERVARLEDRLSQPEQHKEPWRPANEQEALAAQAIIDRAKQEVIDDLRRRDEQIQESQAQDDRELNDWLDELKVVGVLKEDSQKHEFTKMIAEYGLNDKNAAINLWNKLQHQVEMARAEGESEGEKAGIRKAQEAKVASGRRGAEQGQRSRSYAERRAQEPNFDAIRDRELTRLGH